MALARDRRSGLTGLLTGKRAGNVLMLGGLALAGIAGLLVLNMTRQARAAATQGVQQAYVVTVTQDIPEFSPIRPDAVAIKAFPAAFAPAGAATTMEDVVGKFSTTKLVRDQIVLAAQVAPTRSGTNVASAIPPGKVVFWMPMPDMLAQSGAVRAGDRVDILLSIALTGPGSQGRGMSTQNIIQDVEIFSTAALGGQPAPAAGQPAGQARPGATVMAVLLDPQEAITAKYIKDSGGTIDLVLRSRDWHDRVPTEAVTADTLIDRLGFRVPDRWSVGR